MRCPNCNKILYIEKTYTSLETFKEIFKIGDIIKGFCNTTLKTETMRITAIGEERFLFKLINGVDNKEHIATIKNHCWTKIK